MAESPPQLVIGASFTADAIAQTVTFWAKQASNAFGVELMPFAQVYQAVLEPGSPMRGTMTGANILCVRWSDLIGANPAPAGFAIAARELAETLIANPLPAPLLLVTCPEYDDQDRESAAKADQVFTAAMGTGSMVSILDGATLFRDYQVGNPFDNHTDKVASIPYTDDGMVVIGTGIVRWWLARIRPPVKVIGVDCDNTLWGGVVGEDGIDALDLTPGHLALQYALQEQAAKGRLIVLLSKNEEADVRSVFERRRDMVLSLDDVVAIRANWTGKPANLAEMADVLGLGIDSFVFLDDNPVEIAMMQRRWPQVRSIQVPDDPNGLDRFIRHLWLFDHAEISSEDRQRVQLYKEGAARNEAQSASRSLADFIQSLNLNIDIDPVTEDMVFRFAQLTQRTNQFNMSLLRLTEGDVRESLDRGSFLRLIRADDRFGRYGAVGAIRAWAEGDVLISDIFLLSCRALGRGIEHRMVAMLGDVAAENGLNHIEILFENGPRNSPAAAFLASIDPDPNQMAESKCLRIATRDAQNVRFIPQDDVPVMPNAVGKSTLLPRHSRDSLNYGAIARCFSTAAMIREAVGGAVRRRPDLPGEFIAPLPGLQSDLARIWEEVLNVTPVGIRDPFFALGGTSIQLVSIHGLIKRRLDIRVELTLLFEHATIEMLAMAIEKAERPAENEGTSRGAKMRAARKQVQNRRRSARQS